jgi:hypothetical protein
MSLKPRLKVPELSLPVVGGGTFALAQDPPATFTMLVVYRGLHCPICKTYLRDLDRKLVEFESLGVKAVAVSTDTVERADVSAGEKIPHWTGRFVRLRRSNNPAADSSLPYGQRVGDEERGFVWTRSLCRSAGRSEPSGGGSPLRH